LFFSDLERVTFVNDLPNHTLKKCTLINLAFASGLTSRETVNMAKSLVGQLFAALDRNFQGRLIHVSTIAVHGFNFSKRVVPPIPLRHVCKTDAYTEAKGYTERVLQKLAAKRGIDTYIVRCGNVMGPGSTWANKIIMRLIDGLPLIGDSVAHVSNTTFVGNLVYGLGALSEIASEVRKETIGIVNFAEFGTVPWNDWIAPLAETLSIEPRAWSTDEIRDYRPRLFEDISMIKKAILGNCIPLLYRCRATSRYVQKVLNWTNADKLEARAKSLVNSASATNGYINSQEYKMAQIYLNDVAFGLQGVPEAIRLSLPYSLEQAVKSIVEWARFSELDCFGKNSISIKQV
jgi:hypothetical protein